MDSARLQDIIHRAAGRGAAVIGNLCDLYRPDGTDTPLLPANRILRLPASFLPLDGRLNRPVLPSNPMWEGLFDAAYTSPGDLMVRRTDQAVFFIASQQPMLPVLCVRAPRLVDIARPETAGDAGLNLYGGVVAATQTLLAKGWPASILAAPGPGTGSAQIQSAITSADWHVLLPVSLRLTLRPGDRITDDLRRAGIIAAAERTDAGWDLIVRQAST